MSLQKTRPLQASCHCSQVLMALCNREAAATKREELKRAEEELMEARRQELLSEEDGYWRQRMNQQQLVEKLKAEVAEQEELKGHSEVNLFAANRGLACASGLTTGILEGKAGTHPSGSSSHADISAHCCTALRLHAAKVAVLAVVPASLHLASFASSGLKCCVWDFAGWDRGHQSIIRHSSGRCL